MSTSFTIQDENELDEIANFLLSNTSHSKFLIKGEMGAGKTTFIKTLCKYLEVYISKLIGIK